MHHEDKFVELIYFVVNPNFQRLGLGKMLMDKLKEITKHSGIFSIVTFADNRATQFFGKNGFKKLS